MTNRWTNPLLLTDYLKAIRGPGLYVIGEAPPGVTPGPPTDNDLYLGENWPDDFHPHYVGNSLSKKRGMASRISCHARLKGSRFIATLVQKKTRLYFIQLPGSFNADLEQQIIMLKSPGVLDGNIRDEESRSRARMRAALDRDIPHWRELRRHLDDPDYDIRREG